MFEKTVGRTNRTKLVVVAFIGVRSSAPHRIPQRSIHFD